MHNHHHHVNSERTKQIVLVEVVTLIANTILAIFKLLAGIIGNSISEISDAVHSFSDSATTIAVMIGVKIGDKEADDTHPYGHEKLESVIGVIIATILGIIALGILKNGVTSIINFARGKEVTESIGLIALIAAGISIVVKLLLYLYAIAVAKRQKSPALKADAWHHLSDSLSSIGSLVGIAIAMYTKFVIADAIAAIIIGALILKVAYQILREAIDEITDRAADPEIVAKAKEIVEAVPGVIRIDSLKSRRHSTKIYFDVEIAVDHKASLIEAHDIAEAVHHSIEDKIEDVKHCHVHVNPDNE